MEVVKPKQLSVQARGFGSLPVLRQLGLMVGLAASVALGVAVVLWSQTPNYKLLYANLSDKDASLVMDALQKSKIIYKLDEGSGSVLVQASQVHEARLNLAAQGLPKGTGAGFEMLEEKQGFGVSEFREKALYDRALEGELARTIASLSNIQNARIHLALPKQSAFVRNRQKPSASVMVSLFPGRNLEPGQVDSIIHLVTSSVPGLDTSRVTVIDQKGRLLSSRNTSQDLALTSSQFEYSQRLQDAYAKRIEDMLTPIIGPGGVRAQVVADLDFTSTEKTQETYNPEHSAVRSEQVVEEKSSGASQAEGVPGALSNRPPVTATTPDQSAGAGKETPGLKNSSRRSTLNYELDKTISHTRVASGAIRRLSVAVIVDNKQGLNEASEVVRTALTEEELGRITALVKDAVGFSADRGDTINIINTAFSVPPPPEPLPEIPLWEQAWVWDIAKQGLGVVIALVLGFGVLRPVLRSLAKAGANAAVPGMTLGADGNLMLADDTVRLSGGQRAGAGTADYETNLNTAKSLVAQDPKRVAQVVKTWVGTDE